MKTIAICLGIIFFCVVGINAQNKVLKAPVQNTVVHVATAPEKPANAKKPAQAPPVNIDILSASVSFTTGDDGKDGDTRMGLRLWDNNKRVAANYNMNNASIISVGNAAEYFTGATNTVPMTVVPSVPTGEVKIIGSLPLPVLRMATPADFGSGGELRMDIAPNGHDTWKIKSITLHVSFNNDSNSPLTITWNNITVSQDSPYADLLFDKNFNPIQ